MKKGNMCDIIEENKMEVMTDCGDFSYILSLTDDEKRELLSLWKEKVETRQASPL